MMKSIRELYRFEIYKILHSKLTVSFVLILAALSVIMGLQLSKGARDLIIYDEVRTLNGLVINDETVDRMNVDLVNMDGLEKEENYKYTGLAHTVNMVNEADGLISAEQFYQNRLKFQHLNMEELRLSDGEKQWWTEQEAEIQKPFVYVPQLNVKTFAEYMTIICLMAILLTAICLSGVFAGEYRKNMDQLLFSCRNGRRQTFVAKIAAGMTFSIVWILLFTILLALSIWLRTGLDGLSGVIQLEIPYSAYNLTFLQFIGIQIVIVVTATVLFAAMAMALSAIFKNGVAVMGTMVGIYLISQFVNIPLKFRLISQVKAMFPTELITVWSLADFRLIKIAGNYHSMYSVAPIIYIIIAIVLVLAGHLAFKQSQR